MVFKLYRWTLSSLVTVIFVERSLNEGCVAIIVRTGYMLTLFFNCGT